MKYSLRENRIFPERVLAVAVALIVWFAASKAIGSSALLASPQKVASTLFSLLSKADFWASVWFSLWRIVLGFSLAFAVGCVLALVSASFNLAKVLLWPYLALIKATPVASFIILCFIWLDSKSISICISFLMVMPVVYSNILESLNAIDKKMSEMAKVFSVSKLTKFLYIDIPQMKPYIISAASAGMGLAWKAGISAEVIAISGGSIGERLYQAKIYVSSDELFAWTITLVICSIALEKLALHIISVFFKRLEGGL